MRPEPLPKCIARHEMSTTKKTQTQRPCMLEHTTHTIKHLSPGVALFLISGSGTLGYGQFS